jgi:hypothetical protein
MLDMKGLKLFIVIMLCFTVIVQSSAKVVWRADFEGREFRDAIPNGRVNDPAHWNRNVENPDTIWDITSYRQDWPATRRKGNGLIQLAEGCTTSGNTPIPESPRFRDGTIELEMSWNDDDSVGVTFRTSGDRGYLVVFGYNETIALMLHDLRRGCAEPGLCLSAPRADGKHCDEPAWPGGEWIEMVLLADVGFEVDGKKAGHRGGVDNRGILPQDHKHPLYGRIQAIGRQIDIWYMPMDKKFDRGKLGEPMISVRDSKYLSGQVGIWHESWSNGVIDNLTITDAKGFAVDSQGKLATEWGAIKASK